MSFSNYRLGSSIAGLRSMNNGAFSMVRSGGLPKLKSGGLTSTRPSGNGSMSYSSIKDAVSGILGSDVSEVSGAVSGKVDKGLTKEYVSALEAQAKADAADGVYGKDGKASQLREEQMKKHISPDRDGAISQVSKLLSASTSGGIGSTTVKLSGLPYTASITKGLSGTTAEIFDENGEKFASYDSKSGEWKSVATKAESQFQTASSSIYDEAYRAAQAGAGGKSSGLNARA